VHLRRQSVQAGDAFARRVGATVAMHGRLLRAGQAGQPRKPSPDNDARHKLPDVSHAYLTPEWSS
jgi:hypothetical protein